MSHHQLIPNKHSWVVQYLVAAEFSVGLHTLWCNLKLYFLKSHSWFSRWTKQLFHSKPGNYWTEYSINIRIYHIISFSSICPRSLWIYLIENNNNWVGGPLEVRGSPDSIWTRYKHWQHFLSTLWQNVYNSINLYFLWFGVPAVSRCPRAQNAVD